MNNIERIIEERKIPGVLDGVKTPEDFQKKREEIQKLLMNEQFGTIPPKPDHMYSEVTSIDESFCAGFAPLRHIKLTFELDGETFSFPIAAVIPKSDKKLPAFVHINFRNAVPDKYMLSEEIADEGFAVFSICYGDVSSDNGDFKNGIAKNLVKSRRKGNAPGKIALWAWAAMRVMDYIETLDEIDTENVAVVGHSRLGKTALLAGGFDERFKYVISNDSGCCGAAIERGKVGETYKVITDVFPYWFCPSFVKKAGEGKEFSFDQNYLLALSVPRTIIIGSAEEDLWADPASEFLCLASVNDAYKIYGKQGLVHNDEIPTPVTLLKDGDSCYHIRHGKHYLSRKDWRAYMTIINERLDKHI